MKKNPRLSIVIPSYNSEKTIGKTLQSLLGSLFKDFETIVVDDKSTDNSAKIAEKSAAVLKLKENKGASNARNTGANKAKGEIIVFLDADVTMPKTGLGMISKGFEDKNVSALQTLYSKNCPVKNFASQYQNLYQFYNFNKIKAKYIQIASTYCFAIRKKDFIDFNTGQKTAEDGEWGYRLFSQNKKILFDKSIRVQHLQSFTIKKILKRSFRIAADKVKSVKGYKQQAATDMSKTHHSRTKIAAIICSPLPPVFWILNLGFFGFILREKGVVFLLKTIVFHEINFLTFLAGMITGTLYDFAKQKAGA